MDACSWALLVVLVLVILYMWNHTGSFNPKDWVSESYSNREWSYAQRSYQLGENRGPTSKTLWPESEYEVGTHRGVFGTKPRTLHSTNPQAYNKSSYHSGFNIPYRGPAARIPYGFS